MQNKKYLISVIVPVFNSENYIHNTFDSIKNQSIGFENIELIIVDDYSTDSTQELINKYCEEYENIKTYESGKKTVVSRPDESLKDKVVDGEEYSSKLEVIINKTIKSIKCKTIRFCFTYSYAWRSYRWL